MSKPSFSNIDLWLFELSEGNLSPEQVAQLELFLLQYPELDVERDLWEMSKVNNETIIYNDAQHLEKRPVGFAWFSVAASFLLIVGVTSFSQFLGNGSHLETTSVANHSKVNTSSDITLKIQQEVEELKGAYETHLSALTRETVESAKIEAINDVRPSVLGSEAKRRKEFQSSNITSDDNHENVLTSLDEEYLGDAHSVSDLTPEPLNVIALNHKDRELIAKETRNTGASIAEGQEGYESTLKSKWSKFSRKLRRMMDNPVALKNSRNPNYLVPGMTATDINFGSAGTLIATRVQTQSRIQWLGQENEQFMNQLSVDGYSYGIRGGWAIQAQHGLYNKGGIHTSSVAFTYSPKISVSKQISVEPSVRFKMGNYLLNTSNLNDVSQIELNRGIVRDLGDGTQLPTGRNLWYRDLGAGILVNTKWFFLGLQADNLLKHDNDIYSVNPDDSHHAGHHVVATFGTDWESQKGDLSVSPFGVFRSQESIQEMWLGANVRWNWLNVGLAASNRLDPVASIGMKFEQFNIHYNVDYSLSEQTLQRSLSHQLTLSFVAKQNRLGKRLLNF